MKITRTSTLASLATAALVGGTALGASLLVSPALAQGHHGGGHGQDHGVNGYTFTLTTDVTSAIDDAGARVDAVDGAWSQRDSAGRIVLRLGRGHTSTTTSTTTTATATATPTATSSAAASSRHGRARTNRDDTATTGTGTTPSTVALTGGFAVVDGSLSTTWTDLVVDTTDATVDASVDGTTETVFTVEKATVTTTSGATKQVSELLLTDDGATALDGVLGDGTLAAGDVFAVVNTCHS